MAGLDVGRRAAVFLDRDGTLIEDRGDLGDPERVEFLPGAMDALRALQRRFVLFIVTNQAGISSGRLSVEQVEAVNRRVVDWLRQGGVTIEQVFVCPHTRSEGCVCIKPNPHFLRIAEQHHRIALEHSYTVGDHAHDVEFGRRAGATGVFVLTGHGLEHVGELEVGSIVVPSIAEAARVILEDSREDGCGDKTGVAARFIRRGGLVAFPTETVYGVGANALDPRAVARIFEAKQRPFFDPLIVHLGEFSWVERLATSVPVQAALLMQRFWPGPLTIVLPKQPVVPDIVTAGLDSVALRMPDHPTALALLARAGVPICAPSANPFGYVSPTTVQHVIGQLGDRLDCVLDGGPCALGIESTIVGFGPAGPGILRLGALPLEEVSAALGATVVQAPGAGSPVAPGMLPRHYAPRSPLRLFEGEIPAPPTARSGLMLLAPGLPPAGYSFVEVLSRDGDLSVVAHNLFACLRRLDKRAVDLIVAETAPERGLGRAINDRLRRASFTPG